MGAEKPVDLDGDAPGRAHAQVIAESLAALVRTASVNPGMSEARMVDEIECQLASIPCELTRVEFAPGRPSLAAVLRGAGAGPSLVLNGHTDTVAIDDYARWSVEPFDGVVLDGSLWGRGAVDMKGGLAAQIACLRALAAVRDRMAGTVVAHFAAGEECGEPGTLSLLQAGFTGDYGIVTEPTGLSIATAQRGIGWFRICIEGRSTHAATPAAGLSPVPGLEQVLRRVREYNDMLASRTPHPILGNGICTVTMVAAGAEHNAVPDSCEVTLDRRMVPGETHQSVTHELREVIDEVGADHPGLVLELVDLHLPFEPSETSADTPFVALVADAVEHVTGEPARMYGTPYGSDVRNLVNDAGMEAITLGAGDVRLAHGPDERIELRELEQSVDILLSIVGRLLMSE
jgi:succinyl-diaminopimelate desuccinylase